MAQLRKQALTISQQLAQLRLHTVNSSTLVKDLLEKQEQKATVREPGQPLDIRVLRADQLAWGLAMQAQSCAYLAVELQVFAERLSESQITCPESTYNALFDSTEMFRHLLDVMVLNYKEANENFDEGLVPALSILMVAAIRSILDLEPAITTGDATIRAASPRTRPT